MLVLLGDLVHPAPLLPIHLRTPPYQVLVLLGDLVHEHLAAAAARAAGRPHYDGLPHDVRSS